jgi:NAD(P)-dependent dehydrogenase (short-subunit alcohol dehydrogenase family)
LGSTTEGVFEEDRGILAGKVAVISGASRGIGRAIAGRFVEEGARVVIAARNEEALDRAVTELNVSGQACRGVRADLSKAAGIAEVVAAATEWGGIDILVNNVGAAPAGRFLDLTDEQFLGAWTLKLLAGIRLMRAAIPQMIERGGGSIINITGLGGREPGPEAAAIASTNAAIRAVTKSVAREMAGKGIRVNAICPGAVRTERAIELARQTAAARGVPVEALEEEAMRAVPSGRPIEPSEIAEVALFLAGGAAASLTGVEIVVDGGRSQYM